MFTCLTTALLSYSLVAKWLYEHQGRLRRESEPLRLKAVRGAATEFSSLVVAAGSAALMATRKGNKRDAVLKGGLLHVCTAGSRRPRAADAKSLATSELAKGLKTLRHVMTRHITCWPQFKP